MIRREENGQIWAIRQTVHAFVSGEIAAHWIGTDACAVAPRAELMLAAATHDAGWLAADQQPHINAAGQPRDFMAMDLDQHFAIWRESIAAVFAQNRYAGLLTSLHACALYQMRLDAAGDPPEIREQIAAFLENQRAWEHALIVELSNHPHLSSHVAPDQLARNLRLLQVWDYLSLLLCMGPVREQTIKAVPLAENKNSAIHVAPHGHRGLALTPFPLDQPLTIWVDAQVLAGEPFSSDEALQQSLARAPYAPLALEVCPAK